MKETVNEIFANIDYTPNEKLFLVFLHLQPEKTFFFKNLSRVSLALGFTPPTLHKCLDKFQKRLVVSKNYIKLIDK